jgi:lysophospholipase L1-like esterase
VGEKTGAHLIWATTTPVDEEKHTVAHTEIGDFLSRSADVPSYNEVLFDLSKSLDFELNDLNKVVADAGLGSIVTSDGAHFTDEGCALLGRKVAEVVRG